MSDEQSGQDQTQNDQSGDQNSQKEQQDNTQSVKDRAYSILEEEGVLDDFKQFQGKQYSKAYNEGRAKEIKDTQDFVGVEGDFSNTQEIVDAAKEQWQPSDDNYSSDNDNPEAEELRNQLQEWKEKAETKEQEFQEFKRNQKIDSDMSAALNSIKESNKVTIKDEHLQRLFKDDYNVKLSDDGQTYVERQDGTPVLDGEGNRKSLDEAMAQYVKENSYAQPKAEGVGGGTGGGSASGEKPSFKEFKKLMNSGRTGDREEAAQLRNKAKEIGGWAEGKSFSELYNA